MGLFRRKRRETAPTTEPATPEVNETPQVERAGEATDAADATDVTTETTGATGTTGTTGATETVEATEAARPVRDPELGPFDRSAVDDDGGYVDLGAIWVPGIQGLVLTMEVDEASGEVIAVRIHLGHSLLQLQAFAAPKSSGLWDEIRGELVEGIKAQGGGCDIVEGEYGPEVHARLAGRDQDGATIHQPMRFIGVDGPRWFLRGVLSGPAVTDPTQAAPLLDLFRLIVVDRGQEPMAPRELLPLHMPVEAEAQPEAGSADAAGQAGPASTDELRPFERGPEMTETR